MKKSERKKRTLPVLVHYAFPLMSLKQTRGQDFTAYTVDGLGKLLLLNHLCRIAWKLSLGARVYTIAHGKNYFDLFRRFQISGVDTLLQ